MRTFTSNAYLTIVSLITFFCFSAISLTAQQLDNTTRKVVINKKFITQDGNINTEKVIKEGDAVQNFNIDDLIEQHGNDDRYLYVIDAYVKNFNDTELESLEKGVIERIVLDVEEITKQELNGKPLLGVYVDLSPQAKGVLVESMIRGRGAEKAGIQSGDIILDINDLPTNSYDELVDVLSEYKPGEIVDVRYNRANGIQQVKVTLTQDERHNRKRYNSCSTPNPRSFSYNFHNRKGSIFNNIGNEKLYGSSGSNAKPRLGVRISNTNEENGVRILSVDNNSAAELAGLQANDIIEKVDKVKVTTINDLIDAIGNYEAGDQVRIRYIRNGEKEKVKLTLKAAEKLPAHNSRRRHFHQHNHSHNNGQFQWNSFNTDLSKIRIVISKKEKEKPNTDNNNAFINTAPDYSFAELELAQMELFPNPTAGSINIKFTAPENIPTTVSIVDISSKEIFRDEINNFDGRYNKQIDIAENGEGIYFLYIVQGDKVFSEKIVCAPQGVRN